MVIFGWLAMAGMLMGSSAALPPAHPLHNSLMEVSHGTNRSTLDVSLRVFADDFTMAAGAYDKGRRTSAAEASEPAIVRYARAVVTVADPTGKAVAMGFCGSKLVGDMVWLCFRGTDTTGGHGLRVGSRVLFEHFQDQVNLVRVNYSGKTALLMFTPGDGDRIVR